MTESILLHSELCMLGSFTLWGACPSSSANPPQQNTTQSTTQPKQSTKKITNKNTTINNQIASKIIYQTTKPKSSTNKSRNHMNKLTNQNTQQRNLRMNQTTTKMYCKPKQSTQNHKTKEPTTYKTKINKTTNNLETKTKQQGSNKHQPTTFIPNATQMSGLRSVWFVLSPSTCRGKKTSKLAYIMCSNCLAICSNWSATFFLRKRLDKCIASANARQSVLLCWQFQIWNCYIWKTDYTTLFSVQGSQCFVFTVHSVFCSRDLYVATFQPGLANQEPCNVSLDSEERATKKITVSHHLTQPKTVLLHLFHGALTFLIGKLGTVPERKRNLVFTSPFARLQNLQDFVRLVVF